MKRLAKSLLGTVLVSSMLVGCGQSADQANTEEKYKVGLVTNMGSIDDKSFNQDAWEGIQAATGKGNITSKYLQPTGETDLEALNEIANFNDADYDLVVAPCYRFRTIVYEAQSNYLEAWKQIQLNCLTGDSNKV